MSINSALSIAKQALDAHATRLQIHANNMANLDTPSFVRKIPVLTAGSDQTFEDILAELRGGTIHAGVRLTAPGITLSGIMLDPTPGRKIYQPSHPQADADGYITLSNVNPFSDMADATLSSRVYEANLAVMGIAKAMANRALEIGRGQ